MLSFLDKKLKKIWWFLKLIKANFLYQYPSRKLKIIGITGTNGKTTVATLLYNLFSKLGYSVGLISTVNVLINGTEFIIERKNPTTPDSVTLTKIFNEMVKKGCTYVFMEVTSHAIDQKRIAGIKFTGGVFTNLTHDHLDYHKNFENYFQTKKKFFKNLSKKSFALTNIDDQYGKKMIEGIKAPKYTYGFKNSANFNEKLITKLIGDFNLYNVLAVYATAVLLGENEAKSSQTGSPDSFRKEFRDKVKEIIKELNPAEGRFNHFESSDGIIGIVDYAHSVDALENVLKTILKMKEKDKKVISVFGCGGGDRKDHSKRPVMMKTVYNLSDFTIATADNPREEDIENIFTDMKKGLPEKINKEIYFIIDRAEAIKKACELAQPGDYILLAGKGHEKTQEIQGIKYPFNDMEELRKYLN